MKKKLLVLCLVAFLTGFSVNAIPNYEINSIKNQNLVSKSESFNISKELVNINSLYGPDCDALFDAVYEEAIFSGYSFGDALDMADTVATVCEIFTTYLW